ncbi:spore coat protein SP96-like [Drosophila bipectinata]|uniref:spore coat protein SP96-like n=1 Tax=Drosophila bipectinata TaxID=42026 RepID=UPI0038B40BF7
MFAVAVSVAASASASASASAARLGEPSFARRAAVALLRSQPLLLLYPATTILASGLCRHTAAAVTVTVTVTASATATAAAVAASTSAAITSAAPRALPAWKHWNSSAARRQQLNGALTRSLEAAGSSCYKSGKDIRSSH